MRYDRWKRIIFGIFFCLFCLTQAVPQSVQAANEPGMEQLEDMEEDIEDAEDMEDIEDVEDDIEDDTEDLPENARLQFGSTTDYQVDLNTTGSIRIHDRYGDGVRYYLYLIAEFSDEGPAYYTNELSAYADDLSELPDDLNSAADSEVMTEGLVKIISDYNIAPAIGPLTVGSDGNVSFRNLKPGYYLMLTNAENRADGKEYSASPILISVPEGADPELGYVDYDIQIDAKSELKEKPENPEEPEKPKEDEPKPPAEPPKTPKKPGEKLPQTGALWWPLPFLFAGGLLCYFLGIFLEKKAQAAERSR